MKLKKGQRVQVHCIIQPGPFTHERVVTIQSCDGPVSGFVRVEFLKETPGNDRGLIIGEFVKVETDRIWVRLPGSFFTTNGVTTVSEQELKLAA